MSVIGASTHPRNHQMEGWRIMEQTPSPISLDAARKLPWEPGRSAEVFVDGKIEVRFTPQPKDGTPHTHDRDELYFVASGRGFYRCDGKVTPVSAGDLCFAAAGIVHGFEKFTQDFAIWIIFYGDVKRS
jgi:hypothetical protein